MLTAFTNATVFTGTAVVTGKALMIRDDSIGGFTDIASIPEEARIIDCHGDYIAPGFIDLQVYGGGGHLFSEQPSAGALKAMADGLLRNGTTTFLPTIATNSMDIVHEAIKVIRENPHPAVPGLHLEGPYINPAKRGAHLLLYIKRPEKKEVEALLSAAQGTIKMMTLAPELSDPDIIRLLTDAGVVVSAGHSNATFQEAVQGFSNGITATTHLFNAMSPLHHRDIGLPGATFETDHIYAGIIADGIHVDYHTLSISKKLMQERLFLITDAVEESTGGAYVHIKQKDRFTLPDGTLSGSKLTMLQAVKNCVEYAGIPLEEALRMAAAYPARVINASGKGEITAGYRADLVILNKDLAIKGYCLGGVLNG